MFEYLQTSGTFWGLWTFERSYAPLNLFWTPKLWTFLFFAICRNVSLWDSSWSVHRGSTPYSNPAKITLPHGGLAGVEATTDRQESSAWTFNAAATWKGELRKTENDANSWSQENPQDWKETEQTAKTWNAFSVLRGTEQAAKTSETVATGDRSRMLSRYDPEALKIEKRRDLPRGFVALFPTLYYVFKQKEPSKEELLVSCLNEGLDASSKLNHEKGFCCPFLLAVWLIKRIDHVWGSRGYGYMDYPKH